MKSNTANPKIICLKKAIKIVGTQKKLALNLGLKTQGQVSSWVRGRRPVPAVHCLKIEVLTSAQVTRYDLCPEVFGKKPAKPEQQAA